MSQFDLSKWLFPTVSVLVREINTMAIICGVPIIADHFKFDYSLSYCSKGDEARARLRWNDLRKVVYGHQNIDGSPRREDTRVRWTSLKPRLANLGRRPKDTKESMWLYRWLHIASILFLGGKPTLRNFPAR